MLSQFGKQIGLMLGGQRTKQFVHITIENRGNLVQRQVDAVVGNPTLREIVGTDALGTITRTNQRFTRAGNVCLLGAHLDILDPRRQHLHSRGLVGVL